MNVRQLRYIIAVAEELSFTRAAARLNIAQPPLTRQIKNIELELGYPLFRRTKRSVAITEGCEVILEKGRRLLRELDELTEAGRRASRGETGHIAVGFVGSVAFHFFPRILRDYRAKFPNVSIELVELRNRPLIDALKCGRVDVAFMRPFFQDPGIAMEVVLEERLMVALPSRHPLAKRKVLSIRDLKDEPFVTANRRPGPGIYAFLRSVSERAGYYPKVVQEATDIQSVVGLVAAGMGVAIVTDSIRRLRLEGVRYREFSDVTDTARIVVAWRKKDASATLRTFIEEARAGSASSGTMN